MDRNERVGRFENLNRLPKVIREQGGVTFTPEEENHFQETLDVNELGIAFDLICSKIDQAGLPISSEVYDLIVDARSKMECSPADWQKLNVFVR
jgi:hypothetical protein